MYKEVFASRIKKAREEAGYTQKEVSERLQISRSSLSKMETGQLEPGLETLGKLAEFYNTSLNWLLGITLEPEINPSRKNVV